ncbi:MAG: hypothetical protein K2F97_08220 [Muribaculaceae bacterium]|nr:hypothetical protein [Muribaculaceae bacterium]
MPPRRLLFVIIAALYGVLSCLCPPMQDDFTFMGRSLGVPVGWDKLALGWEEVTQHFSYDVGRLSNVLATVFLCLFPRWVFGLAQAFVTYVALEYGSRLARLPGRSLWCVVWAVMWVFALPWFEGIIILDFSVNYLWPSALIIFVLYEMFATPLCRVRWWTLMAAACAGWLHEQFGVAVCCGFLAVLLLRHDAVTRPRLALALAFVGGTFLNFVFPGIWVRADGMACRDMAVTLKPLHACLTFMVYASAVAVPLAWRHLDRQRRTLAVLLLSAAASAYAVLLCTGVGRGTWAPQFFGCLCMLVCLPALPWKASAWLKRTVAWSAAVLTIASLSLSVYWMAIHLREFREVERRVMLAGRDCIYYDPVKMPLMQQALAGFRVPARQFRGLYARHFFGSYYCDGKPLRLLPSALLGCKVGDAPETAPDSGLRYINGCVVATPGCAAPFVGIFEARADVTYSDGSHERRVIDPVPFTDADGRAWAYIDFSRRFRDETRRVLTIEVAH